MSFIKNKLWKRGIFVIFFLLITATFLVAETTMTLPDTLKIALDTVWVLFATFLIFFMNLGFAMIESGLCRAKNTINILAKNFIVFSVASISFWIIGFGLMFGNGNAFIGLEGIFFVGGADASPLSEAYSGVYAALSWATIPLWAKFIFQLAFAGTAATIVSGVVAERVKFHSFILFSAILVAVMYPITGHWIWGGGWLQELRFFDFAGSTVVHSVGGWAGLAAVIFLGPRYGKYRADGTPNMMPGHNMSTATLGALVLWFGWFGFNPGSTMAVGDGSAIAHIVVTTNMAAVMAVASATITSWIIQKKPDLSMILNGALAGLVAITAGCAFVSVPGAAVIGFIAGFLVVIAVMMFDKLKLDDPVGALSVHLVNGVWGTLAVGLFAVDGITGIESGNGFFTQLLNGESLSFGLLGVQALGVLAVGIFIFGISCVVWAIIKATLGIRVPQAEEIKGLDIGEHGGEAYNGFQIIN